PPGRFSGPTSDCGYTSCTSTSTPREAASSAAEGRVSPETTTVRVGESNRYPNAYGQLPCGTAIAVTFTPPLSYTTPGRTSWTSTRYPPRVSCSRPSVRI